MFWEDKYTSEKLWTNNNCESVNDVLKMKLDWRPVRLLDLINHLHDIVKLQYADLERTMYGQGNYQLVSPFTRHQTTAAKWHHTGQVR